MYMDYRYLYRIGGDVISGVTDSRGTSLSSHVSPARTARVSTRMKRMPLPRKSSTM